MPQQQRRNHLWLVATLLASSAAALAAPSVPAGGQAPRPGDSVRALIHQLTDSESTPPQREQAARRILEQTGDAAIASLAAVLEDDTNPRAQLAVARVLCTDPTPHPALAAPLRHLVGADRTLTETAIQALSNFSDSTAALTQLTELAASRQQREATRLLAISALGNIAQKPAAEFLIKLLSAEQETPRLQAAADDALVAMTGRTEYGRDPQQWLVWWSANAPRPESEWRAEVLANQASRYARLRVRYDELAREAEVFMTEHYQATAPEQQQDLLLRYLRSPNPQIRSFGARLVREEAVAARKVPDQAREYLTQMIGDGDRAVRLSSAAALHAINDPGALSHLLDQIAREQDPDVRGALAAPLASIGDLKAVPVLRMLLHDRYTTAAAAAAAALREMGPTIREKDAAVATEIADELRSLYEQTPPGPGTLALREAMVEAMVPLRSKPLMQTFYRLLRETSSVRIRWAALRALGELGDPQSADTIARYLDDRESGVRLEAVRAVGRTAPAEHAEELYRRLSPTVETDAIVREEAWKVLEASFARISLEQLPGWDNRFAQEPARRLPVLRALIEGYTRTRDAESLASAQQRAGVASMELNQPADAAAFFKPALDYWQRRDLQHMLSEQLADQYLQALLRARQYAEAVRIAGELVKGQVSYQQTAGVNFKNELERLQQAGRSADCLGLIEQIRKMEPPLAAQYQEIIAPIEQSLRRATTQEVAKDVALPLK